MPATLDKQAEKEAQEIISVLDRVDFQYEKFNEWLKEKGFNLYDTQGWWWTFKGNYGYIQLEGVHLAGRLMIANCAYAAFTEPSRKFGLLLDGKSASGKTLLIDDLELLHGARQDQVKSIVFATVQEEAGQKVRMDTKLFDDLMFDADIEIPSIVMAIEDQLDCVIHDEDAEAFQTVGDIVTYVRKAKGIM